MKTQATTFLALLILLITTFATAQDNFYSRSKTSFIQPENPIYGFHPTHKSEELDASNLLSPILPDFQVNENAGPCGAFQDFPIISMAPNGNFIVAWFDFRNGGKGDIFVQRFARDGSPIGNNFQVNDRAGLPIYPTYVSIAIDANENFIIAWVDERNGKADIYAQRFTAAGNISGGNFKVNDDERANDQLYTSVIVAGNGDFIFAWMSELNYNPDIYAQRYDNAGTALGKNFKVNDDDGNADQTGPSIASDQNGNFIITWRDERDDNFNIYAQRYSNNGNAVANNFKINDDRENAIPVGPIISHLENNNFVISWREYWETASSSYAQLLTGDGTRSGKNFKIQCDHAVSFPFEVSIQKNGNFLITWQDLQVENSQIYAQRIFHDGTALGNAFIVSEVSQNWSMMHGAAISSDSSGNFAIVWADSRNREMDIYTQQFSETGVAEGNNFKINDDNGAFQSESALATTGNGNFIVTWEDNRNGDADIFAQRYTNDGTAADSNFKVNSDQRNSSQKNPAIVSDTNGNFVIAWEDERDAIFYANSIFAQRYANDGTALGSNFRVDDDAGNFSKFNAAISADANGNFVITWSDGRDGKQTGYGTRDIYAQRYSSEGTASGNNFKVNEDTGNSERCAPVVAFDAAGNFVIAWNDERDNDDIYAQRFSGDGTALGANFRVNLNVRWNVYQHPAIACAADGGFVITWEDQRNEAYEICGQHNIFDIYAQRFASDGAALGENFKVNDDPEIANQATPAISVNESGHFIITWTDYRNGIADIYAQRYLNDGTKLGENFRMTNTGEFNQSEPAVQLLQNRIYTTWTDNRAGGTGTDIWANILNWENPDEITVETSTSTPVSFFICQNYPNPFNPETSIVYELPAAGEIKIEVFDIRGRLVNMLINAQISAGIHRASWNGENKSGQPVASGVYYYRVNYASTRERKTAVRKMMLIR